MTRTPLLTRRAFATGIAGTLTALLAPSSLLAQVPPPSTASDSAHALRDFLAVAPITSYEGVLLEPVPWIGTSASPYLSSVGGVHVLITDRSAAPFGSYVVYRDDAAARDGVFLGKRALEGKSSRVSVSTIGGYPSEVIAYTDDIPHAVSLVPIRNVLVIGNDTVVQAGEPASDEDVEARAIDHATVLIAHLLDVLDRHV